jgi:hypothetical protein
MNEQNEKPKPETLGQIYKAALKLSSDQRGLLVAMLKQNDNQSWASPEIEQAWMEELDRRERLFVAGKNDDLSWEEARKQVVNHLEAQQLSPNEQKLLAAKLNQTDPPGFTSPEIKTAWLDEVRSRRSLHAQGKTRDVPGEEVFTTLQKKIAE